MKPNNKLGHAFRIASLLEKLIKKNKLTASEREDIEKWLAANEGNRALLERITDERQLALALVELQGADTENELAKVRIRISGDGRPRRLWRSWAAAAVVLFFLAMGVGIYRYTTSYQAAIARIDVIEDVPPGGNRATLTLADGRTIDLSEAQTGIIVGDGIRYADGSVVLSPKDRKSGSREESSHTGRATYDLQLSTPQGGTYQIMLADGTKVWLNSASTLKYPSKFIGNERVVELEGEAFFEVRNTKYDVQGDSVLTSYRVPRASESVPFRVVSKGQTVEVLGTQFNISAYPDESEIKTTLVEGRVKVHLKEQREGLLLNPDEQAILTDAGIQKRQVDIEQFVAWKNGLFSFRETELRMVMSQLSRWYDIAIAYQGDVPPTYYYGAISRNESLAKVLELLQQSGLNFKIERIQNVNRLTVLP